ncbi:MAG: prolipoprotein diacylglyceryl transferase [Clostridia bacterium]|nr:prolipoprotein diacylglyceryl transferase [Clostridia bacterium]
MYSDPLFHIGGKDYVTLYGICIAVGVLCCVLVLFKFASGKVKESFIDFLFYNGIVAIVVGFVSACLFQAIYAYIENPEEGFDLFNSGMTFIGGLIGGVVSFLVGYFIFRPMLKNRLVDIISLLPCCIVVAHAFGRVGCFFAGCCYGKPTESFLGVKFPFLSHKVHPTQLYEAFFLFALFAVMLILYVKKDFKHNLSLYLLTYGIFRFLIEFVRGDERGTFVTGISPSQFWSILMVVASVGVYFLLELGYKLRAKELDAKQGEVKQDFKEVKNEEN